MPTIKKSLPIKSQDINITIIDIDVYFISCCLNKCKSGNANNTCLLHLGEMHNVIG